MLPLEWYRLAFSKIGQEVQVRIADVNTDNNTVNLSMVPANAFGEGSGRGSGGYGKRPRTKASRFSSPLCSQAVVHVLMSEQPHRTSEIVIALPCLFVLPNREFNGNVG